MSNAYDITAASLANDIRMIGIISQNLANTNTAGYKRDVATTRQFSEIQMEAMNALRQPEVATPAVPSLEARVDHSEGMLRYSGNPLDVVIEGDGYFQFAAPDGYLYGRSGAFSVDAMGRLVNSQGYPVMSEEGETYIGNGNITIDKDGTIKESNDYIGKLDVVYFENKDKLSKAGHSLFRVQENATPLPSESASVSQGYTEVSNVKPLDEMVKMMSTLRHFETTSNVLKGYDQMMGTAISTIAEF